MACVVIVIATITFVMVRHHQKANVAASSISGASSVNISDKSISTGSQTYSIQSGGVVRTYHVYVPSGLSGTAALVVMLHGGGGSGQSAEKYYGWDGQANSAKFVVAYPDGLGPNVPAWNVDGMSGNKPCCGYPARNNISDIQFIQAMISQIESKIAIDKKRVYATGISNGGMMTYTLACETNLFAAIGPDSATMLNACSDPSPISVIHIHGLDDTTIPFNGGAGQGTAAIDGPSVPQVIADWRKIDDCNMPVSTTAGVVVTSVSSCTDGRAVELITIANGGHGWPGSPVKSAKSTDGGNDPSQALDATSVIWQFFAAHPKQ